MNKCIFLPPVNAARECGLYSRMVCIGRLNMQLDNTLRNESQSRCFLGVHGDYSVPVCLAVSQRHLGYVSTSTLMAIRLSQLPTSRSGTLSRIIQDPTNSADFFRLLLKASVCSLVFAFILLQSYFAWSTVLRMIIPSCSTDTAEVQ